MIFVIMKNKCHNQSNYQVMSLWSTYMEVGDMQMDELVLIWLIILLLLKIQMVMFIGQNLNLTILFTKYWRRFQAKMITTETLVVSGNEALSDAQFTIPGGWSIIGYLNQSAASPESMMQEGWIQMEMN